MRWKAFVLEHHPDAVCAFHEYAANWSVWLPDLLEVIGVGSTPASAWKDAADEILRR